MGRPKSYDRQEALRSAMRLFWSKGYEGAHLQELVEVAGINRFSLYKEFGGKEGLYREAIALYLTDLVDVTELLVREPLGLENILAMFRAETRERFPHGCMALNMLPQKHVVPEDVFDRVRSMIDEMERAIRQNLKAAMQAGEIDADHDLTGLTRLLTSLDIGLLNYEIHSSVKTARQSVLRTLTRLLSGA